MKGLYKYGKYFLAAIRPLMYRRKVIGREKLYIENAAILCCNHKSMMDPLILCLLPKRQVFFMAKKQLFENKFLGWLITKLGAYEVDRDGADVRSIKTSLKLIKEGKLIGIFPEGTRAPGDEFLPFHDGVAMLAIRTGVAVIPIGISKKFKWLTKITISIGESVDLSGFSKTDLKEATGRIEEAVKNQVLLARS